MYSFRPMLGPYQKREPGSPEWAERLGNTIQYTFRRVDQDGIEAITALVKEAVAHEPWKVWPQPPEGPCRNADEFFRLCCDHTLKQVQVLINVFEPQLGQRLAVAAPTRSMTHAEAGALGGRGNKAVADSHSFNGTNGSESEERIVRRLKRDHPEIAEQLARGEFPSARAAGIAAGTVREKTPLDMLRKAWKNATDQQRAIFLAEISAK